MTANKTRAWVAGTVVLCLLLSAAGWFLAISPKRAEAAEIEQQTVATRASNQQLEARIEQLREQFADLPRYQAELAAIQQAMPDDPALPTLVRDLDEMATSTGVTLMALSPGQPAAVAEPEPTVEQSDEESGEDGEESEEAEENDAAADPAAQPTSTTTPVGAGMVLVSVPVNVELVGDFFKAEMFLKQLQAEMQRAFLVQDLTIQALEEGDEGDGRPATKNGDVEISISGSVFVLKGADDPSLAGPQTADPTVESN